MEVDGNSSETGRIPERYCLSSRWGVDGWMGVDQVTSVCRNRTSAPRVWRKVTGDPWSRTDTHYRKVLRRFFDTTRNVPIGTLGNVMSPSWVWDQLRDYVRWKLSLFPIVSVLTTTGGRNVQGVLPKCGTKPYTVENRTPELSDILVLYR